MTQIRIVFDHFPAIQAALRPRVSQAIRKSLFDAQAWIQEDMAGAKGGRVYHGHTASAPGETPAIDTGGLVGSLSVDAAPGELHGVLSEGPPGEYLELGTVYIAPRPHLQPAAVRIAPGLGEAVKAILEGGGT